MKKAIWIIPAIVIIAIALIFSLKEEKTTEEKTITIGGYQVSLSCNVDDDCLLVHAKEFSCCGGCDAVRFSDPKYTTVNGEDYRSNLEIYKEDVCGENYVCGQGCPPRPIPDADAKCINNICKKELIELSEEEECTIERGQWIDSQPITGERVKYCNPRATDAGKPCSTGSECTNNYCKPLEGAQEGQITDGFCYQYKSFQEGGEFLYILDGVVKKGTQLVE